MKTTKKDRYATANNINIGDTVEFLQIPYYTEDLRMFWVSRTVENIKLSETGKRVTVSFTDGHYVSNIGPNTPFCDITDKFMKRMEKERGWRN